MKTLTIATLILFGINLSILTTHASADASGQSGPAFSSLPIAQRRAIERRLEPPPAAQRNSPYSTPMYYLLHRGYRDGVGAMDPTPTGTLILDRNRPDWQEVILRDWVELGLTSTLFLTTPNDWAHAHIIQAIEDYCTISKKLGLRVAIRIGGDHTMQGIEGSGWGLHPKNPDNHIDVYVAWVARVAAALKGRVDYYIIGDEVNANSWEEPIGDGKTRRGVKAPEDRRWTPQIYLQVFAPMATTIKSADPAVKVSMFGMGGLDWPYVKELLDAGYAEYGDAVAANIGNKPADEIQTFVENVRTAAPHFKFYSNGVGYVPARDTNYYPVNPYKTHYGDVEQAQIIAKTMIKGFDAGWDALPYYIIIRQWVLPDGSPAPHWYGFFGFADLLIDQYDNLTVKRYPGWYAFQTVAHTFYDKTITRPAAFDCNMSQPVDFIRTYIRNDECLIVLWNDSPPSRSVTLTLPNQDYRYPVSVALFNYRQTCDIPYTLTDDGSTVLSDLTVGPAPVIIRLIR